MSRSFLIACVLVCAASLVHGDMDVFDVEDIFSRGLLQGSTGSTDSKVAQGTVKFIVTLAFFKTETELKANQGEAALKKEMVDTLFKGVIIGADDIVLTYQNARRRLLAGTTVSQLQLYT